MSMSHRRKQGRSRTKHVSVKWHQSAIWSTYPDRSREPQRGDVSIAKGSDNAREEVLERLRQQASVLHKDEDVKPIVANSQLGARPY